MPPKFGLRNLKSVGDMGQEVFDYGSQNVPTPKAPVSVNVSFLSAGSECKQTSTRLEPYQHLTSSSMRMTSGRLARSSTLETSNSSDVAALCLQLLVELSQRHVPWTFGKGKSDEILCATRVYIILTWAMHQFWGSKAHRSPIILY